jgi:hypothetical protein
MVRMMRLKERKSQEEVNQLAVRAQMELMISANTQTDRQRELLWKRWSNNEDEVVDLPINRFGWKFDVGKVGHSGYASKQK